MTPKITFQPKLIKGKYYLYMRISAGLKVSDTDVITMSKVGKTTVTRTERVKKYKSLYLTTGIVLADLSSWDALNRRFIDQAMNTQLDNIKRLTIDIMERNKAIIDKDNTEIITSLINKLVFGKKTKEFKLLINGNSIVNTQTHYDPDKITRHKERYQHMPRIEGDVESVVEELNELLPVEKTKKMVSNMKLSDYIEKTYKGWQDSGQKGYDSARTYRNSMTWVSNFEKAKSKKIRIKDFNQNFVEDFVLWSKIQTKKDGDLYAINYLSDIRKQLQVIDGELRTVHNIHTGIKWDESKTLKKTKEKSIDIALNQNQINEILNYKVPELYTDKKGIVRPSPKGKYDALALIKVGIYTGLRQIDLNNINLVERDGKVYVDQTLKKTGTHVKFLVHPIVKEIWLSYNKALPSMLPQNLGDYFQDIGKELGWTETYSFTRRNPQAGKTVIQHGKPFYKMLKTSTLRRTFASMAVNVWNLPISEVSKVLSHFSVTQTMEYVRVDESALNKKLEAKYDELM